MMLQEHRSRREMLKLMLAAVGGTAAAAFLPDEWLKPVIKSGVLPVHAQTSGYTITLDANAGCWLYVNSANIKPAPATGTLVSYVATGVQSDSTPVTLTHSSGSGNTDASGYADFTGEVGFDPDSVSYPVVFSIVVTVGSTVETFTRTLNLKPKC